MENGCIKLDDAWWAALFVDLLHPVQVAIIEAFGWIGQPLTIRDLSQIIGGVEPVRLDHHLGRLRTLGVIDCRLRPPGADFMSVSYRLTPRKDRRGRW